MLLLLQSARQTGGRRGDAWQPVEDALKKKLLGVLLDELGRTDGAELAATGTTPSP